MTEEINHKSKVNDSPHQSKPFIEILCSSSAQNRRFAAGTKAGFALTFMNNKLIQIQTQSETHLPLLSHIQSVKDGEDPIVFGPTATLVDFGPGWKLVSVVGSMVEADASMFREKKVNSSDLNKNRLNQDVSVVYLGKILGCVVLMFLFGALCTLFLENVPELILYIRRFT